MIVSIILRATCPPGGSLSEVIAITARAEDDVTRLAKCPTDLRAGDEVTPSPNHRTRRVHVVALCGVRQAEFHVRRVRHGSINLYA